MLALLLLTVPQAISPALPSDAMPSDLSLLVGKQVIVGRLPLCVPKSYTPDLSYAGKPAVVVSFRPNPAFAHSGSTIWRMPTNMRALIEDARHGGVLTFRFADGVERDTCVDQTVSQLTPNLEPAPGETFATASTAVTSTSGEVKRCPLTVIKVTSGLPLGHAIANAIAGGGPSANNFLDLQVRNDAARSVRAFEYTAVYRNSMGDEVDSTTLVSQNAKPIAPGDVARTSSMDAWERGRVGRGDVLVYINRIRFADNAVWSDDGSRSCAGTVASR